MRVRAISELIEQLKALGDITRLKILRLLIGREYCVCELARLIGISQPGISQHLRKLKVAGFVTERKNGQWVYYRANDEALGQFLEELRRFLSADIETILGWQDESSGM